MHVLSVPRNKWNEADAKPIAIDESKGLPIRGHSKMSCKMDEHTFIMSVNKQVIAGRATIYMSDPL